METLFISDLDGTLLGSDALLSADTIDGLNRLIDNGVNFTVATARTNATVVQMFKDVNLKLPVILMNGVAIFDISNKNYIATENISPRGKNVLIKAVREHLTDGFFYCIDNNTLSVYYEKADSTAAQKFIEERERVYSKKFTKVKSFEECKDKTIVYFSIDAEKEKLEKAYNIIKECTELHPEFYRDIYNTDHWYLEVCSHTASKKNAVKRLRNLLGAEKVISFGDNLNDIPMFEASDESYAVANAKDEVKLKADGVIESNLDNGVVKFIEQNF